jgi:hypothetical protein
LTIRPVTQTADVAVKAASTAEIPLTVEKGIISSIVPARIKDRNPAIRVLEGFRRFFIIFCTFAALIRRLLS